ncbi:MAG: Uma2 family endonuclease [Chitinophagaceae bacterium]|jgi:Uma2 family endonuclease|nr:Uma2 family endonuclease [Chitinophagaceae bacterium]
MENIVQEPAVAYQRHYTPEEYLAMEWVNGVRYEYWEGELIEMGFATQAHNRITFNINKAFQDKKAKDGCGSFQESIMVRPANKQIYFLPDVVFTCNPDDLDPQAYQINHPTLIVEVLSESTELHDRVKKWEQYRTIRSLRHFLLVSQQRYQVEMYSRSHEHALFYYQCFDGLEGIITFPDLGFNLPMQEVYSGLEIVEPPFNPLDYPAKS